MTDLRKAAEIVLETLNKIVRVNAMDYEYKKWAEEAHEALRQALSDSEWIGLEDDDFNVKQVGEFDVVKFARYIEAKLKEKNT